MAVICNMYYKMPPKKQKAVYHKSTNGDKYMSTVIHHPYRLPPSERRWDGDSLIVVSFDSGTINFCMGVFYKETRKQPVRIVDELIDISEPDGGTPTDAIVSNIVDQRYGVLHRAIQKHSSYIYHANYIIIEKQLSDNYAAVRVSQHIITQVIGIVTMGDNKKMPMIVEIDPRVKSRVLMAPAVTGKKIKKWSCLYMIYMCYHSRNVALLEKLLMEKKRDDLSDIEVQIEAFMTMNGQRWTEYRDLSHDPQIVQYFMFLLSKENIDRKKGDPNIIKMPQLIKAIIALLNSGR